MRAVSQVVQVAAVSVDGETVGRIGPGLVVFLGVGRDDEEQTARSLAERVAGMRVFPDENGRINRSVQDCGGSILVVSQFTLYGECKSGTRPSFSAAAPAVVAEPLYLLFVESLRKMGLIVETGVFGARMLVTVQNDGPVTIIMDTKDWSKNA